MTKIKQFMTNDGKAKDIGNSSSRAKALFERIKSISGIGRLGMQQILWRLLFLFLVSAAVVAGTVTLIVIAGGLSPSKDLSFIIFMLWIDLAILGSIAILTLSKLMSAWLNFGRRNRSNLLARVTLLFSVVAIVPTVLVSVFAIATFNLGVKSWFAQPVATAIHESEAVATAYLKEHKQTLVIAALEIGAEVNRSNAGVEKDTNSLSQLLDEMSLIYDINEAVLMNSNGDIFAIGGLSPLISAFRPDVDVTTFEQASSGTVILIDSGDLRSVDALLLLHGFEDAFLYVTKFVDEQVVESVQRTGEAAEIYSNLQQGKNQFQYVFMLIFAVVGLLLLLAALGFGMLFAGALAKPIARLTSAAIKLGEGDLSVRIPVNGVGATGKLNTFKHDDEIENLITTFNVMAHQLDSQKTQLVLTNSELDERRKFTEAVLSGVSAGVIGLSADGIINLPNAAASRLLDLDLDKAIGRKLVDLVPEFRTVIGSVLTELSNERVLPNLIKSKELDLKIKGEVRTFRLFFVAENDEGQNSRCILTFDDITELQLAQKTAAWSDVARRIAHEIKNPLTPIQLSAERLKRRYSKQIEDGRETFDLCTDTIIRQVSDIGRMVDEFAKFARTPSPILARHDIRQICEQAVFLQNNSDMDVEFVAVLPENKVFMEIDANLISQSVSNLLKNAGEAIESRREIDAKFQKNKVQGLVRLTLIDNDENGAPLARPTIYVQDNGCGIPDGMKQKLTEPYVTTRAKGTGLGLAIVKKIFEDHGGSIQIDEAVPEQLQSEEYSGATFALYF
ncbi:MAG: ATP-binding protein [Alphaproteobacteria bacterium]